MEKIAEKAEARLDMWLAEAVPEHSRSRWQSLIKDGRVTVNGAPCKANQKIRAGDRAEWSIGKGSVRLFHYFEGAGDPYLNPGKGSVRLFHYFEGAGDLYLTPFRLFAGRGGTRPSMNSRWNAPSRRVSSFGGQVNKRAGTARSTKFCRSSDRLRKLVSISGN